MCLLNSSVFLLQRAMDLGLARAERAIMVAKEAASQIGVIMMTQRMKIMIILQSKICMYMEIVKRSTFHPACGCCLAVVVP